MKDRQRSSDEYFSKLKIIYIISGSCIVLYCIGLYCIALHCIALYCIVLYCIVLYCIVSYCIVSYCIVLHCIALHCLVLYCIVLYCIVDYLMLIFIFQIKTSMKQFQGLHKTVHLLQNEHVHLFSRNQVLIKFLKCLEFCAVFIDSRSEFQILGPWKHNDLLTLLVVLAFGMSRGFLSRRL